jgi:hypothetical protein
LQLWDALQILLDERVDAAAVSAARPLCGFRVNGCLKRAPRWTR